MLCKYRNSPLNTIKNITYDYYTYHVYLLVDGEQQNCNLRYNILTTLYEYIYIVYNNIYLTPSYVSLILKNVTMR